MATVGINLQYLEFNTGQAATSSVCHSRIPLPKQEVYKGARQQADAVWTQTEKSSFRNLHQGRQKLRLTKAQLENKPFLKCPQHQRASLSPWPKPFPCIGHHFLPDSFLALFFITDSSGRTTSISNNSPPWLPGSPCCHCRFQYLQNKVSKLKHPPLIVESFINKFSS